MLNTPWFRGVLSKESPAVAIWWRMLNQINDYRHEWATGNDWQIKTSCIPIPPANDRNRRTAWVTRFVRQSRNYATPMRHGRLWGVLIDLRRMVTYNCFWREHLESINLVFKIFLRTLWPYVPSSTETEHWLCVVALWAYNLTMCRTLQNGQYAYAWLSIGETSQITLSKNRLNSANPLEGKLVWWIFLSKRALYTENLFCPPLWMHDSQIRSDGKNVLARCWLLICCFLMGYYWSDVSPSFTEITEREQQRRSRLEYWAIFQHRSDHDLQGLYQSTHRPICIAYRWEVTSLKLFQITLIAEIRMSVVLSGWSFMWLL